MRPGGGVRMCEAVATMAQDQSTGWHTRHAPQPHTWRVLGPSQNEGSFNAPLSLPAQRLSEIALLTGLLRLKEGPRPRNRC